MADVAIPIKNKLSEGQLRNWKLLNEFQRRLESHLADRKKSTTELDPRRQLQAGQYLSLVLLGMLNPAIQTARALCGASHFERVQEETGGPPVSQASFSEMQRVVDPELVAGLLREVVAEAQPIYGDAQLREHIVDLIANDGTLLPALPRMAWALWQNPQNRAGKLHLEFFVWRQVPVEFTITDANTSERAIWKANLRPGAFYVNDRNYSHDYGLIGEVQKAGASFVLRLHNNAVVTGLEPARALTEADRRAGVVEDVQVATGQRTGRTGGTARASGGRGTHLFVVHRPAGPGG